MDKISKEKRSWNMAQIKSRDTKPEKLVRSLLHRMGFRFRIHKSDMPGKPDIVLPKYRTVIFVHGCFWHRHKGCKEASIPKTNIEYWNKKFKSNVIRDDENKSQLEKTGWSVLIVWECEMKNLTYLQNRLYEYFRTKSIK